MKRILNMFYVFAVSLLVFGQTVSSASAAKPDKISVVHCIDCVQFHFQNDQNQADGLIIDIWRLWSKKTGIEIEFKAASWEETLRMVGAGEADVHAGLFFNDERNKYLEYGSALTETDTHFFVHKSLAGIKTVEGLKDHRVGVLSGDFVEGFLKEKLPPENIFGFESYESMMSALKGGVIKAFAADTPTGLYHLQKAGLGFDFQYPIDKPLYSNTWFTAARKGNTELIDEINAGMELIDDAEREAIERRWSLIIIQKAPEADVEGVRAKLSLTEEERQWLNEHPVIRVHNEKDWPPFNFFGAGRPQGFSIDYMKLLAAKIGINVEFITGPSWDGFLKMMKSGDLDVMLNIVRTPERETYMHYTESYTSNPNAILSRQGKPYQQLDQLEGKTVAVTKGFFQEEILRRDFPGIKLYLGTDATETMKAVAFGKADAALGELTVLKHLISREMMTDLIVSGELKLGNPEFSKLNIAVRWDWPMLASIFRKAMDQLDPKELELLRQKWSGVSDAPERQNLQLSDQQWQWLSEHQHMRMGIDTLYPPFEFVDENGAFSGMASDYVKLISERLGITMEVISDRSWIDVLEGIENKVIDVLPSISGTPERAPYMNFAKPHIAFPLVVVTRDNHPFVTGLKDFKGKKVALMSGYGATARVKFKHPSIIRTMFEDPLQVLQAVAVGNAEATVLNLAVATYLIKKHNINNLKIAAPANIELPGLSFGVRKDWPEFIDILNRTLASITSEEESAIRSKWAGIRYEQGLDMKVVLQVGGVAIIVLIVFVVWNRRLSHEVAQRKKAEVALRESEQQMLSAFQSSTAGMFMHDGPGNFFKVNNTFCDLLGYSEQEYMNMNWRDVTYPDDLEFTEVEDSSMVDGGRDNFVLEKRYQHKNGSAVWGRLFTSCVRKDDGSINYIFCQVYDITDRKRTEAELAEKQAQLRTVMENVPGGIRYIDEDGNYVLFNAKYLELYDFPEGVLKVGEHYRAENIFQAERGDFGEGDPAKLTDTWLKEKPLTTEPLNWERATVEGRTLQVNTAPVPTGGVVNIVTDITERKQAEQLTQEAREQAAAAEALLNDAIENFSAGFVLYDIDDRLVMCNGKFMDFYNYTDKECHPGLTWLELEKIDTGRGTIAEESECNIPRGQRRWDDFERLLSDGRWIDIRQRKTSSGGMVSIQVDITDRKHAEQMMKEAREHAEQIADAKSEFIAVVSHEVRTPMNGVLGMARLLTETKLDDEQREFADTIVASGEALITIINDLLDISKLDANKLDVESLPFSAIQVVEHVMALMKLRTREKGLTFTSNIDSQMPVAVIGDSLRLRQILLNLISNAIKFTDHGAVSIEASVEKQTGDAAFLSFSITDSGKGIPADVLEKLFSPYSQGSVDVARKYGGTGLGLTICRRLAALMDGEITVESTVNKGSVFYFKARFPLASEDEIAALAQEEKDISSQASAQQASRSLRILQVEDNAINRTVIERVLTRVGHRVTSAVNGAEALKIYTPDTFDVILMDRHMPVMDGLETTKRIRKMTGPLASIPIVGITAGANQSDIDSCLDAGMDQCLTKPVDAIKLRALLENLGGDQTAISQEAIVPEDMAPDETSPIDMGRLARTLGEEDKAELMFMLGIFNEEFPKLLENLDTVLAERDVRGVHDSAHAAKGAAANAAATALTEMLKGIEVDAHQENWDDLEIRVEAIKIEYSRVIRFCDEHRQ
ncbi:MAG: transporter substrate-binding domain-containing protein [Rhodospirillaceae bacterium]|jgi:PAS domain S-box-containing protein|nr:transporter substrate-binding domain-containing protein [Rhodospirillaceae bacterium]MBT5561524.1 transporter substrate-binding domain-containing protein [Rhodospirillaceae bacterium]MBT6241878.1 transporter substrate-binding domain-containing protein [Rhodospirillaceae bacterium]MBT7138679.1 transporter substrate-binding domain-containing protein [Rhodospirillaceae bacterium]